jgi:hypothetical protein
VAFGSFVSLEGGLPGRLPPAAQQMYSATYDSSPFNAPDCFINSDGQGVQLSSIRSGALCGMGMSDAGVSPSFLVWGDSHAAAMAPAIDVAARQLGLRGLFVGEAGCPPLLDVDLGNRATERCRAYNSSVLALIAARHIPVVFMVALWPKYVHRAELPNEGANFDPAAPVPLEDWSAPVAQSLDRTLADLGGLGTRTVMVMDVPEIGYLVPEALAKAALGGRASDIAPSWDSVSKRQALARRVLETYAAKHDAAIIDPLPALCDRIRCQVQRDGIVLYKDSDHLTASAARSLAYIYVPFFKTLVSGLAQAGDAALIQAFTPR